MTGILAQPLATPPKAMYTTPWMENGRIASETRPRDVLNVSGENLAKNSFFSAGFLFPDSLLEAIWQ